MRQVAEVHPAITLRCHHCSHSVGTSAVPMKFVAMFKASLFERMPAAREGIVRLHEVRKKCDHCGWINIFHPPGPAETPAWRNISLKGLETRSRDEWEP
jgi:phage FluMu protein Com